MIVVGKLPVFLVDGVTVWDVEELRGPSLSVQTIKTFLIEHQLMGVK